MRTCAILHPLHLELETALFKIEGYGQISNGTVTEAVKYKTGMGKSDPEGVEIFGAGDGI